MKTYEQFKEALIENMEQRLDKEAEVSVYTAAKTNHLEEQVSVRFPESKVAPSVNLHTVFLAYQGSNDVDLVAERLVRTFSSIPEKFEIPMLTVDEARENIFYEVISKEKNEELLKDCLHWEIRNTDLVMILRWKCGEDASFIVKHGIAEHLGITERELFKFADDNLAKEEYSLKSMNKVMAEMLGFDEKAIPDTNDGLYVLTNQSKQYGARILFKPGVKEAIREKLGAFYILPSSLHEFLILSVSKEVNPEELKEMVLEVNQTEVAEEDILSDHVYRCGICGNPLMIL